jgi:dienelactone hydrolase
MARGLPDALQLREIKYGPKTSAEERGRVARRLAEAGRVAEALDLFLLAGDTEGEAEVRRRAVAEGQPLLLVILRRAGRAISKEEWLETARAAVRASRWREAYRCYTEAGDEAGEFFNDTATTEIYTPQGK